MKIKNTRELVLRAQSHARFDRIEQGTYGLGRTNGHADYRGCAIACLAAPHRQRDLRTWLRGWIREFGLSASARVELDGPEHRGDLEREFGICEELSRVLETIFEGFRYHGEAIEFVPNFAKALAKAEGVNITSRMVMMWEDRMATARETWESNGSAQSADSLFEWFESLGERRRARMAS